jgi:uncharacterized protein (DUF302 family)
MKNYFKINSNTSYDEVLNRLMNEMRREGFGDLREVNPRDNLMRKMEIKSSRFKIMSATNPQFAYEALMSENETAKLLPVKVMIQELADGQIEVDAMDPLESLQANVSFNLKVVAELLHLKLQFVLENI